VTEADANREAGRLRSEHPSWVIVWLPDGREFRAYRRLRGRDISLAAPTATGLTTAIKQAEQAARHKE
jgi:hypothetical protein